ncbi:MAG: tetratricopeptide repeat protein [Candidatus Electrothrix scaldis]|nr:MAG: tetratricopeptide repeat protein [Candidatus Electrothrix sp. GW3-3]
MTQQFTQTEADHHNALVKRAGELSEGLIFIHDAYPPRRLSWLKRRRMRKAIQYYKEALEINPAGWSSMWFIGKIYQRLGDHATSLEWFTRAYMLNPTDPNMAREAGLAALDCGEAKTALTFCQAAVDNKPDDYGLLCNLALAHMLSGNDEAAVQCATRAVEADPTDEISANVQKLVCDVRDGKCHRPKTMEEAFPNEIHVE